MFPFSCFMYNIDPITYTFSVKIYWIDDCYKTLWFDMEYDMKIACI